ncbi:MAG: serine/threonine protein kinase [Gammaproteobacteria bacterium]|nr:serine/threonine protein kinase [Gammaproteobacteria bacterium]
MSASDTPYGELSPDLIADALESLGFRLDSGLLPLNSYENRVYQFRAEDGRRYVTKFYRPGRWSDAQIQEEHDFCDELLAAELPVSPPLRFDGASLVHFGGHRLSVFDSQGGRAPELDNLDHLAQLGRLLARIHLVGETRPFLHRPALSVQSFGHEALATVLAAGHVPDYVRARFETAARELIAACESALVVAGPLTSLRLHGDCHPGNVLWTGSNPHEGGPHFVDFDDSRSGPAMQDLWMLLSGSAEEQKQQFDTVLDGYEEFREFDWREWRLREVLRALRMLHYSAWLSSRWADPAFPMAFPWFGHARYWEEQCLTLHEQLLRVQATAETWP